MREIIFRGKRVDDGHWVQGYYVKHETRMLSPLGDSINDGDIKHKIIQSGFADWNMPRALIQIEVIPETVGQYTGYREEKSGKMLFDGDNFSVETWEDDGRKSLAYFTVCWDNDGLCWMAKSFCGSMFDEFLGDIVDDSLEIIGNIHEEGRK